MSQKALWNTGIRFNTCGTKLTRIGDLDKVWGSD